MARPGWRGRDGRGMSEQLEILDAEVMSEDMTAMRVVLLHVTFDPAGQLVNALARESWTPHVICDGACIDVPASAFWPWVAGLVGLTVPTIGPAERILVDFDRLSALPASTERIGLTVARWGAAGVVTHLIDMPPAELLTHLCRLAGKEA